MKTLSKLLFIVALLGLGFNSCKKLEVAGEIPGMGNSAGKLEAKAYDFHEDLVFSPIRGVGENSKSASIGKVGENSKSASSVTVVIQGVTQGSGNDVIVTLSITNNSLTGWRSAYLRAGTVFEVNLSGYQNAILLAPVVICLTPAETRIVTLYLYCLNQGQNNSDNSASYNILGVTQSEVMMQLVNALQFKMVNYDDYMIYYGKDADVIYDLVKVRLQEIVWHITNGNGMTAADVAYINSLTDLPAGVLPVGIYNLDFNLPDSWCAGCRGETAWGGPNMGPNMGTNMENGNNAWWFYLKGTDVGTKQIYAGQYPVAGASVEYKNGEIIIILGGRMRLLNDGEAVKIMGFNDLPESHPNPGHFTYKGTDLTVKVEPYAYYAIHLDVAVCN